MRRNACRTVLMCALGMMAIATTVKAQEIDYPADSVRLFVPAAPGGGTDSMARLYAKEFEEVTGSSMAVVNQSGGGGVVAFQSLVSARPDGATLLFYHSALHVASHTGRSPFSYEDMYPLATFGDLNEVFVVPEDAPYSNIQELVSYLEEHPDETLRMGVQQGGGSQLKGQALSEKANNQIRLVDAGSEGQRIPMVLGGQLDISVMGVQNAIQYEQNGDIKVLAVVSDRPDPAAPDWPTTVDQGVDISLPLVFALYAPKGIDDGLVTKLDEINTAINDKPAFQDGMKLIGVVPAFRTHVDATRFIGEEDAKIAKLLK